MNKRNNAYMVLLVDRKKAVMFTLFDGSVGKKDELIDGHVPQKVKHGDDTWDAQDKIFRHIEDHLHRHLKLVSEKTAAFAKENNISKIIIGSHKPLFSKIENHLPHPLSKKVKGKFITELKTPFNEILRRAKNLISELEAKN